MAPSPPLQVSIPIETEVVVRQRQAITAAAFEAGQGLRIDLDLRRLDWCERLGLPPGTAIHWEKVRTTDVRELSSFLVPLFYRVTLGDGWYMPAVGGKKVYFGVQKHLVGLDLQRKVTTTALRAAVLLAVMAAYGERFASALRDLGYKQPRVFGYVGFVIASTFTPAKSHKKVAKLYNQQTTKIGDIGRASANRSEWNLAAPFPDHVPGLEWELAGFLKWSYKITP